MAYNTEFDKALTLAKIVDKSHRNKTKTYEPTKRITTPREMTVAPKEITVLPVPKEIITTFINKEITAFDKALAEIIDESHRNKTITSDEPKKKNKEITAFDKALAKIVDKSYRNKTKTYEAQKKNEERILSEGEVRSNLKDEIDLYIEDSDNSNLSLDNYSKSKKILKNPNIVQNIIAEHKNNPESKVEEQKSRAKQESNSVGEKNNY